MKTFLIQTVKGEIVHDFAFTLIEAIKYHNWFYNQAMYDYKLSDTPDKPMLNAFQYYRDIVPVGSVEFMLEYLKEYHNIDNVKPLNIPTELQKPKYLQRAYTDTIENIYEWKRGAKVFVKSMDRIKGFTDIVLADSMPEGNYTISELIDIDSEWRTFVYNADIVGLQNYSGDFTIFPNVCTIKDMINDYVSRPKAFTLDVGVNKRGAFIIECHDFFSCGMYGFADYKVIPAMFIATWNKLINVK